MKQNQDDSIPQFTGMKPLLGRRIVQVFTGRWRRFLPTSCAILPAPPITIGESWPCIPAARVLMHRERLCAVWRRVRLSRREVRITQKAGRRPRRFHRNKLPRKAKRPLRARCAPMSFKVATHWYRSRRSSIRRLLAGKTSWTRTRTNCRILTN